jgi:hypothetical protein
MLTVNPKSQAPNPNKDQILFNFFMEFHLRQTHFNMSNEYPKYDLDKRTFMFAKAIKDYVDELPGKTTNFEIGKQLVRAAYGIYRYFIRVLTNTSYKLNTFK